MVKVQRHIGGVLGLVSVRVADGRLHFGRRWFGGRGSRGAYVGGTQERFEIGEGEWPVRLEQAGYALRPTRPGAQRKPDACRLQMQRYLRDKGFAAIGSRHEQRGDRIAFTHAVNGQAAAIAIPVILIGRSGVPRAADFAVMRAVEVGEQIEGWLIEIEDVLLRRRRRNRGGRDGGRFSERGEQFPMISEQSGMRRRVAFQHGKERQRGREFVTEATAALAVGQLVELT